MRNMKKTKRSPAQDLHHPEAIVHITFHFLSVLALLAIVLYLPIWLAIVLMVLEIAQMKYFGHCFLTVLAHKRGFMKGMTYWQYIPYLLGVKNYKQVDRFISSVIKLVLLGILVIRLLGGF